MSTQKKAPRAEIRAKVARLPTSSGVYLMKGRDGKVFYVGKASNLRARVRSYFRASGDTRAFVAFLDRILYELDFVVTANEREALLLENNLIKEHRPRYNVRLRDDKNYLAIRLDTRKPFPRLELVRRLQGDGARYFGPYPSAHAARRQIRVLAKHLQLRICSDRTMASRSRPCLQHQIGRCLAPCTLPVDPALYAERVGDVILFLSGRGDELDSILVSRMMAASESEAYEEAARLRDTIAELRLISAQEQAEQHVVEAVDIDQDVVGMHREGDRGMVCLMTVRRGRVLGTEDLPLRYQEFPDDEMLSSLLGLRYEGERPQPDEVLLPVPLGDATVLGEWLTERRGRKVRVVCPRRGYRRHLVDMANRNALAAWEARGSRAADAEEMLERLAKRLRLSRIPRRIECFDISSLQGDQAVGSMAVMVDGELAPKLYRLFQIRSTKIPDDYASMREVLSRRFARAQAEEEGWEPPDLLLIDGGKGQLGAALAALSDLGVPHGAPDMDVAALAKERPGWKGRGAASVSRTPASGSEASPEEALGPSPEGVPELPLGGAPDAPPEGAFGPPLVGAPEVSPEEGFGSVSGAPPKTPAKAKGGDLKEPVVDRVFLPGVKDPIRLRQNTAELFLLARLRDEAHRFAITHHRKKLRRSLVSTSLLEIPGVGEKRAKALLRSLGSVRAIAKASPEELAGTPGISGDLARSLWEHFHTDPREA